MKLIICLLQCFNQIFHFNLTVYSRAKIIFFKMGILTELLPMTNLLIPPPNPAHTPEEEEGLPQQDYHLLVRYFSSYHKQSLVALPFHWSMIYSGESSSY